MTPALLALCRRLGRRPLNDSELTDDERRALAAEDVEHRGSKSQPLEKRGTMERRVKTDWPLPAGLPLSPAQQAKADRARAELLSRPIVCTGWLGKEMCSASNHLHPEHPPVLLAADEAVLKEAYEVLRTAEPTSQREGKVLSAKNEGLLREAHAHLMEVGDGLDGIRQAHDDIAEALGALGSSGKRDADDRAVEACEKLRETLLARRCFKKYREGLWDELYRALEVVHRASLPPGIRQAYA
jgi:hypothetical protein